jgi:hypothetical protein
MLERVSRLRGSRAEMIVKSNAEREEKERTKTGGRG